MNGLGYSEELTPSKVIPFRIKGEVSALPNAFRKQAWNPFKETPFRQSA